MEKDTETSAAEQQEQRVSKKRQGSSNEKKPQKKNIKKNGSLLNPWKIAFLTLVGVIVASLLFVIVRVTQVREPEYKSTSTVERAGSPVLSIQSNKEQVNQLISFFLNDFQEGSDITYDFYLKNEAMLTGTFKVLGYPIQFSLYFDPYVMDNGNVQLKAKSLSIGTLGLPIKDILNYIKRDYKLPAWVEVNPSDKYILLRLDKFQMQNGLYLRAEKINLIDDDIEVNLYLPESAADTNSSMSSTEE